MSTEAIITMTIVWSYVLFFVVYFFMKILKSDRELKGKLEEERHEAET